MKRKFKILIMVISIVAMLFAFAIVSNASDYINTEGVVLGFDPSCTFNVYTNIDHDFESSCDETFGFAILSTSNSLELGYALINIEFWDSVITEYNVVNSNGFIDLINEFCELGYVDGTTSEWNYEAFTNSEGLYNAYLKWKNQITEEDLETKYNEGYAQGETDGVTEYKESEEYTSALNNKYSTGYAEGIESFKASTAYTDALDLQYSNGKVAGVTEFKNSIAFANALKAEYEEGYDAGVLDTQGVNTKNETTKLISILIGVAGFGILFMAVLSAVGAFKKRRAKRR